MRRPALAWIAALAGTLGCASVSIRPVDGAYREGLRFYRPAPYLLVTSAKDGAPVTSLVWLPDRSQEYYVVQKPGWGTSDLRVRLDSGWNLVELGHGADSKGPETLGALGSLAEDAGPLLGVLTSLPLEAGLYELLYSEDGRVSGVRRVPLEP